MLALMTANPAAPELFLATGATIAVPTEVIEQAGPELEFEYAVRWAFKAGFLTREQQIDALSSLSCKAIEMGA